MRHIVFATLLLFGISAAVGCGGNECEDQDGDGFFGKHSNCTGARDCDDSDDSVHPDEDEVCDNGRDDDCNGEVDECGGKNGGDASGDTGTDVDGWTGRDDATDDGSTCTGGGEDCTGECVDEDGDGWGVEGANVGSPESGPDCNDADERIHPGAEEICNGTDDDCDGKTDECSNPEATCQSVDDARRCLLPVGGECETSDACPQFTVCDGGVRPSECRKIRGEDCSNGSECRSSLECSNGRCAGDYCQENSCSGDRDICDDSTERCVECRHWYDASPGELPDCNTSEVCLGGGACGTTATIDEAGGVSPYPTITRDVLDVARELAICWRNLSDGDPAMCVGFETTDAPPDAITESDIRNAYDELKNASENGNLQNFSEQNLESLGNLLGDGSFNSDELAWDRDIPPSSSLEYCAWYHDHGLFGGERLHVGQCDSFEW